MSDSIIIHRNTYSPEFKFSYVIGIIPTDLTKSISRFSLYNFKKYDYSKVVGFNYSEDKFDVAKKVIQINSLYKFNKAIIFIYKTINQIYSNFIPDFHSLLKSYKIKQKVISVINCTKNIIELKRVCKYFHISTNTFYNWAKDKKCNDSILYKCFKRHPSQLTIKEVNKIKYILTNPITKLWPLVSCYYYGLRNNIISFRLRTFYKYAHILGFSKPLPKHRRKKHDIGIRASKPDELWHADLTIFKTLDNIKVYIYIVMDNFSRKILNYKASLKYSASLSLQCLKEAYEQHILPLTVQPDVKLMVDGGSEINNNTIDQYLNQDFISVQKIIAQQDVSFSNSMIEAVNKILKYNYLFKTEISDFDSCVKYLDSYIPNYNDRFHCSLNGLSPNEAYSGISLDEELINNRIITARTLRINTNRKYRCRSHNI